jgi:excinuclease UvrABC helicase subunit UvrB
MINPIINVLSGFNSTVFIYGMTGAGKTYTMFGENTEHSQEGLVSMTIDYLFDQIYQSKDIKSQVHLSFF